MTERVWNFSAGPATLPPSVLEQAAERVRALPGARASVLEISHRSPAFDAILDEAEANLRDLLGVPDDHHVLFLQGGASLQFSMVPMNLLHGSAPAAYVVTGSWGTRAVAEARVQGDAVVAWDGAADGYASVPDLRALDVRADAAYLHVTSNETIQGVEFRGDAEPAADRPPLVADVSSDFLSRPLAVERYGLVYAGAQKNAGPAGVTIVMVRNDLLRRIPSGLPAMLDYRVHAEHRSRYNTPTVFAIDVVALVTRWIRDEVGGLEEMHERNREKASLLYEAIDGSDGFYRGHAASDARSLMNVTFHLPTEALETTFVRDAADAGLVELRGHRSVGGIRASIYNAMPLEGVRALRGFMDGFRLRHA